MVRHLTAKLKYLDVTKDRYGNEHIYFRYPRRGPRVALPSFDDAGFLAAYHCALAKHGPKKGHTARRGTAASGPAVGTIRALLAEYYASQDFKKNKPRSQRQIRSSLDRFSEAHGHRLVKELQRKHVSKILGDMAETPGAANTLLKWLRKLMNFAILNKWRVDNPTFKIEPYKGGSYHTWTEDEIARFEAHWPLGSHPRLLFALLLYTGQRRSDVAKMTWADYDEAAGTIAVAQMKGDMEAADEKLIIRCHKNLRAILEQTPRTHMLLVALQKGKQTRCTTDSAVGHVMERAVEAAQLPDECVTHGLRKAAARRLAEAGCSPHEIMAITGHRTLKEVQRYTRAVEQKRLAQAAIDRLEEQG